MRAGIAVIGANYGDEGKGLVSSYFSSRFADDCTVVRFNGGAQAGHTVVTPDGRRHVFSHFGAGSFSGCPTYLSQFFVVNPRLFIKELRELEGLSVYPKVSIDPRAFVTTPIDVLVNQAIEMKRGKNRHGSCGVGINETVTRCLRSSQFATQVKEFVNPAVLKDKLMILFDKWLPLRLEELAVRLDGTPFSPGLLNAEAIVSTFIDDCEVLLDYAEISFSLPKSRFVLFEGAQGLMLDENRLDQFPHVTRSKTGLENVAMLCRKFGIEYLDVNYVTRTYLTRHGAGPLPGECSWRFADATNVPNPFQGNLRHAPLNVEDLKYSIDLDLRRGKYLFPHLRAGLVVTCVDQLALPDLVGLALPVNMISYGPCTDDIETLNSESKNYLKSALKPISRASAVLRA